MYLALQECMKVKQCVIAQELGLAPASPLHRSDVPNLTKSMPSLEGTPERWVFADFSVGSMRYSGYTCSILQLD